MKDRIGKVGGNGVEAKLITGSSQTSNELTIGTFHSICRRYLVKYGSLINLTRGFGIADTDDTYDPLNALSQSRHRILNKIIKETHSNIDVNEARQKISMLKSNGVSAAHNMKNNISMRKVTRYSEKSETSFEMAQIYL